ncbi:MAG: AAA family ATPase, partial [Cyanobacteria bacterium P01_F01_bin.116]
MTQGGIPSSPEQMQRYFKAAQVFTPSSPVDSQELFAGRPEQITQVLNAVAQKGQHVILYGERGVGKTSLANYILQIIEKMVVGELTSAIINCDGVDQFFTIWQKVFRELGNISNHPSSEAELLPEDVTPEHIRYILQQQSNRSIIVIDELDRVSAHSENSEYNFVASAGSATELLADTIKTLSDHSIETTIILVGVADSVDELIN